MDDQNTLNSPPAPELNTPAFDRPLLIGRGKMAKHLRFYFATQGIEVLRWENARTIAPDILKLLGLARSVWLLVSDSAISEVHQTILKLHAESPKSGIPIQFVHTSAATEVPGVIGFHPLMTFGPNPYDLETYEKIPFTCFGEESDSFLHSFAQAFPNKVFHLEASQRAHYHALCVMASNFPQILWTAVTKDSEQNLKLPETAFDPLIERAFINFVNLREKSLTGPLVRGDQKTIAANLTALHGQALAPLYESFVKFYDNQNPRGNP